MSNASNVLIISADCHAGGLPAAYKKYMAAEFHDASDVWWVSFVKEMISRAGTTGSLVVQTVAVLPSRLGSRHVVTEHSIDCRSIFMTSSRELSFVQPIASMAFDAATEPSSTVFVSPRSGVRIRRITAIPSSRRTSS